MYIYIYIYLYILSISYETALSEYQPYVVSWPHCMLSTSVPSLLYAILLQFNFIDMMPNHRQAKGLCKQGAVSIRKTVLPGVAIPMLKIRRPNGRLIFNIGIAIPR